MTQLTAVLMLVWALSTLFDGVYVWDQILDRVWGSSRQFVERRDCFERFFRFHAGIRNLESAREILVGQGEEPRAVEEAFVASMVGWVGQFGQAAEECRYLVQDHGEIYTEGERSDVPNWVYRYTGGWH